MSNHQRFPNLQFRELLTVCARTDKENPDEVNATMFEFLKNIEEVKQVDELKEYTDNQNDLFVVKCDDGAVAVASNNPNHGIIEMMTSNFRSVDICCNPDDYSMELTTHNPNPIRKIMK